MAQQPHGIVMENAPVEIFGQIEAQQIIDLPLARQNHVGEVRSIKYAMAILFQVVGVEIEGERQAGPEAVGGVDIALGMAYNPIRRIPL